MELNVEREAEIKVSATELRDRLMKWAQRNGFACASDLAAAWTFTRGSPLRAIASFDIRQHPTEAVVRHIPDRGTVYCGMRLRSTLAVETGGDRQRMQEQLDLLVAHVKGAL